MIRNIMRTSNQYFIIFLTDLCKKFIVLLSAPTNFLGTHNVCGPFRMLLGVAVVSLDHILPR